MVASRWSSPVDLSDAIEWLAVEAQAAAADADGTLDRLEEELFRFGRIVAENPDLRSILANRTTTTGVLKSTLIKDLLSNKTAPATLALISVLVDHPRGRNLESGLTHFAQAASERRNQVIAHVKSATAMSDVQVSRLNAALAKQIGRNVRINVEVDKSVVGGISIRFADELIDGTVVSRLAEAGRRLVS
jgi:F-type H+-transporting ATPase subunit delta